MTRIIIYYAHICYAMYVFLIYISATFYSYFQKLLHHIFLYAKSKEHKFVHSEMGEEKPLKGERKL